MSVLLDTNILARLAQKNHAQHIEAVKAVDILRRSPEKLFIVPQNLFEFWVVCTRPIQPNNGLGFTTSEAAEQINRA